MNFSLFKPAFPTWAVTLHLQAKMMQQLQIQMHHTVTFTLFIFLSFVNCTSLPPLFPFLVYEVISPTLFHTNINSPTNPLLLPRPSFHHHHLFMFHTNQAPHLKMKSDFSSLYIVPSVWKKGLWVFCSSTSSCGHKWLPWQPTVHIFLLQE